ncbi:MAG TPA: hypothetical protein VL401_02525 [Alphaproteobacteria bacterium]|jgi:hypothetical protein|nr:hypothetical protein [Alphaproteobacteria bacterium]
MSKVIVICIIVALFVLSPFVVKVKIECRTQYGNCPFKLESGDNLYQTKKKTAKYLKNNFLVTDFSMHFKLPDILRVDVLIKKPSFMLKNDTNQVVTIDQNGRVLGTSSDTALPSVSVLGNLKKVGEIVDQKHLFALNLMQGVNQMYQIDNGKIEDDSLVVELPPSIKVIFPLSGDSQILLGSLRLVYSKVGEYHEIDLRFKNPVLR